MCGEMNHHPSYQQGALAKCYVTSLDMNFPLSASKQCLTVHVPIVLTLTNMQVLHDWSEFLMFEIPFDTQSVS